MKKWVTPVKLLVSVALLAVLFININPDELVTRFLQADLYFLFFSVFLSFTMVAVSTWKWWYFQVILAKPLRFRELYRWYFIGYFYSNLLPSNIGGDVVRAWLAGRACGSNSVAVIAIFAERFSGLLFLLVAAVLSPFLASSLINHPAVFAGMVTAAGALAIVILAYYFGKKGHHTASTLFTKLGNGGRSGISQMLKKLAAKMEKLSASMQSLIDISRSRPGVILNVTALTGLFYLLMCANVAIGYRVFGEWPVWHAVVAMLPIALIAGMIPVSLGNVGVVEWAFILYFGLAGMDTEVTLAMALLLRLKIIFLGLIGMMLQWTTPGSKPAESPAKAT